MKRDFFCRKNRELDVVQSCTGAWGRGDEIPFSEGGSDQNKVLSFLYSVSERLGDKRQPMESLIGGDGRQTIIMWILHVPDVMLCKVIWPLRVHVGPMGLRLKTKGMKDARVI